MLGFHPLAAAPLAALGVSGGVGPQTDIWVARDDTQDSWAARGAVLDPWTPRADVSDIWTPKKD